MKIENYYLDLKKVNKLESKEQDHIHRYYVDMMCHSAEGRDSMAQSIFNTLSKSEYLVDIRDEKIEKIIKG